MADFSEVTTLFTGSDYGVGGYGDGPYGGDIATWGDEYVSPATWVEVSDPATTWTEVTE